MIVAKRDEGAAAQMPEPEPRPLWVDWLLEVNEAKSNEADARREASEWRIVARIVLVTAAMLSVLFAALQIWPPGA